MNKISQILLKNWLLVFGVVAQIGCVPLPTNVSSEIDPSYESRIANLSRDYEKEGLVVVPDTPCLIKGLLVNLPDNIYVVETQLVIDSLYPWLESNQPIDTSHDLEELLSMPKVADSIRALGVRYLITSSQTQTVERHGDGFCGSGYGGGGCLAIEWGKQADRFDVAIWDIEHREIASKITTEADGGHGFAVLGFIPLIAVSNTEGRACEELASLINQWLRNIHINQYR